MPLLFTFLALEILMAVVTANTTSNALPVLIALGMSALVSIGVFALDRVRGRQRRQLVTWAVRTRPPEPHDGGYA